MKKNRCTDFTPVNCRPANRGFTLVELSIVLVIIGLIVGGIVVGKAMIRTARIRAVVDEAQRYTQAVGQFKDKYMALPGDFTGATALWGQPVAGCPSGARAGKQTCNGDGDGRISIPSTTTTYYEQFIAWQHLANAGMIEGFYTGVTNGLANTENRLPGTNIPASQLTGAGWGIATILVSDASPDLPYVSGDIPPGTVLWLGGNSITGTTNTMANMLTTAESLQIDQKVDDGIATTGKIVAQINPSGTACYSGTAYDTTQTSVVCSLVFKTGF